MSTNFNNFVTIDNSYSSQIIDKSKQVHYNAVIDPEKHQSTTSTSYPTPFILPRVDFNIYSSNILTYTPLHNIYPIFLFLGSQIIFSLSRPSFRERRLSISMTKYYMMMLTKICTFASHSARI